MKKLQIISLTALIVLSVSCQKDPDTNKLDDDYIVYTNYDIGTDFKSFNTFHVIDSILIIGNSDKAAYWNNDNSQKIGECRVFTCRGGRRGRHHPSAQLYKQHLLFHFIRPWPMVEQLPRLLELGWLGMVLPLQLHLQLQYRFNNRRAH